MGSAGNGRIAIHENGRAGNVTYTDDAGELTFHWEFGGADTIVIVQAGTAESWRAKHPRAYSRRVEILRLVAAEMRRRKAPDAHVEIDERTGDIVLRQVGPARPAPPPADVAWYYRLRELKLKLALLALAGALGVAALAGVKAMLFEIDPGKGTSLGPSVRTDHHIATLIQTLEAYTPSLNRDHSKDRYSVSVFIVSVNAGSTHLIRLAKGLAPSQFALAKVLGSDGVRLWVDVNGVKTVDLSTHDVQPQAGPVPDDSRGRVSTPFPPGPETYLSAGFLSGPTEWTGLHSGTELANEFQLQKFVRRVVPASNAANNNRDARRLYRGTVEPDSSGQYFRLLSLAPLSDQAWINGAFLRLDDRSEPLRLADPASALLLHTSDASLKGTAVLARVDDQGHTLWNADSGIDRFRLEQILPGSDAMVLVGTRPAEPGKVPEPLLVIVDNLTGRMTRHSLWQ